MQNTFSLLPESVFKDTLAQWSTGLAIITTRSEEGQAMAVTINSWTAASLKPPLVSFYLKEKAWCAPFFGSDSVWGTHLLGADQHSIAQHYARSGGAPWIHGDAEHPEGSPLIPGCLAWLECQTVQTLPVGDHTLILGHVTSASTSPGGKPLLYWNRGYRSMADVI